MTKEEKKAKVTGLKLLLLEMNNLVKPIAYHEIAEELGMHEKNIAAYFSFTRLPTESTLSELAVAIDSLWRERRDKVLNFKIIK